MAQDFRGFGAEPQKAPAIQLMAEVVENDPKVPWVVAVFTNGPKRGERTYVFPPNWTQGMQDRALLEWGVDQ